MRETSGMQIYSVRLRAGSETGPQIDGFPDLSWVHRLPFKPHNLKVFSRDDQRELKRLIALLTRCNRIISRLASGPRGSVYNPAALPPDQA